MLISLFQQAWSQCRAHKLRNLLALFSLFWGAWIVALLLALSQGFYDHAENDMKSIANGQIIVRPHVTSKSYHGHPAGTPLHIAVEDVLSIPTKVPGIQAVTFMLGEHHKSTSLSLGQQDIMTRLVGTNENYGDITQKKWIPGSRFIDKTDINHKNRVIVIGTAIQKKLFPHEAALGKRVLVNQVPFTVIGAEQENHDELAFDGGHAHAYIPYTTYQQLNGNEDIAQIIAKSDRPHSTSLAQAYLIGYLAHRYAFDPTDTQALIVPDLGKVIYFFEWFFSSIHLFLVGCGLLTLSIGGIGVANMMFLIVTERTHEIGLQMALGAPDAMIMLPLLIESFLIVFLGGLAGLITAALTVILLHHLPLPTALGYPTLSLSNTAGIILLLISIGLAAGFFPAQKATRLAPIQALAF